MPNMILTDADADAMHKSSVQPEANFGGKRRIFGDSQTIFYFVFSATFEGLEFKVSESRFEPMTGVKVMPVANQDPVL